MRMICRSFRGGRFEICQEADLLQHVGGQILCLVDDEHGATPSRVGIQQVLVEPVDQHFPAFRAGRVGDAQLVAHRGQQLDVGELGIQDERHVHLGRQLLEQAPAEGGLPGPDFAGELDETAPLTDSVQEMGQALAVPVAHVEIARVRRDGKRRFREAEIGGVHHPAGGYRA